MAQSDSLPDALAAEFAKVHERMDRIERTPQLTRSSIDDGRLVSKDRDGRVREVIGKQSDGSHGSRVIESPPQPTPDAPVLSVGKTGVIAVRWGGGADAPVPLVHGHIEVQAMGPSDSDWQVVGTIRDRAGGATTFAADESGTTQVRLVMVGQDRVTRSEASDVSEIEVELPASTSEVQAAIESADGKNVLTYDPEPPAADGQGIGDVHFQINDVTGVPQQSWRWDGTDWVPMTFGDGMLESLSAGKITAGVIEAAVGIGSSGWIRSTDDAGRMSEMIGAGFRTEAADGTPIFDSRGGTGTDSTAFGIGASSSGISSTAIGQDAEASGRDSTALGIGALASTQFTTAVGKGAVADSEGGTALGDDASATGLTSAALGSGATATGHQSTAVGVEAEALADEATAVGRAAAAGGEVSLAVGVRSSATNVGGSALGYEAQATHNYATSVGYQSAASGDVSASFGPGASASGYAAVAIGRGAEATEDNVGVLGGAGSTRTNRWIVPGDFDVQGTAGGDGLIREIASPVYYSHRGSVTDAKAYVLLGRIAVVELFLSDVFINSSGGQDSPIVRLIPELWSESNRAQWTGWMGGDVGIVTGLLRSNGDVSVRWANGTTSGTYLTITITYPIA